jgi:hypothetical protein
MEKLFNDDIHNVYSSPNIIKMVKSRGIMWEGMEHGIERAQGNLGVGGRIQLKWISK